MARDAGVSVSTVSRVLNDKDDVAPETYEKVQGVIAELGYTSSLAARSMRSRRTGVIGLILPDLEDPFCIQVMKGINHAIVRLDYDLIAYTSGSIKQDSDGRAGTALCLSAQRQHHRWDHRRHPCRHQLSPRRLPSWPSTPTTNAPTA